MKRMNSCRITPVTFGMPIIVVLFLMLSSLLFAQNTAPYKVVSLGGKNIQDAELITSGGSLTVIHEAGQDQRLEIYIRGNSGKELSNAEIEERLNDKYDLTIETSSNMIKAHARSKSGFRDWKNALSISFKLYVPAKFNTVLKTSGGSISLNGLNGKQHFTTSGGSLNVKNMKGDIKGITSGGSITVTGSEGNIQLTTSGGSITATDCTGDIDLKTSGGSLKLDKISGKINAITSGGSVSGAYVKGELKAGTSGGSVRLNNISASLDAFTSGGNIDVSIVGLGEYVKLRNSAGSINLKLPAGKGVNLDLTGMKVSAPSLVNFDGSFSSTAINGKLNGGGVAVTARSGSGRVNVSFQ